MVDIIIEVENGTPLKYEMDENTHTGPMLRLDRVLTSAMAYPGNYGYIPGTLSKDGDALDALLITPYRFVPGCIVKSRPLGVLIMTDEKGLDEKVIMVPDDDVDPNFAGLRELADVPQPTLKAIEHFFKYYKVNESGKWSQVEGFEDREAAERLISVYSDAHALKQGSLSNRVEKQPVLSS